MSTGNWLPALQRALGRTAPRITRSDTELLNALLGQIELTTHFGSPEARLQSLIHLARTAERIRHERHLRDTEKESSHA